MFGQHWPNEILSDTIGFPRGSVNIRYASNAQLCAINEPDGGFKVVRMRRSQTLEHKAEHTYACRTNAGRPLSSTTRRSELPLPATCSAQHLSISPSKCTSWESGDVGARMRRGEAAADPRIQLARTTYPTPSIPGPSCCMTMCRAAPAMPTSSNPWFPSHPRGIPRSRRALRMRREHLLLRLHRQLLQPAYRAHALARRGKTRPGFAAGTRGRRRDGSGRYTRGRARRRRRGHRGVCARGRWLRAPHHR